MPKKVLKKIRWTRIKIYNLFHVYCFRRAHINAGFTFYTHVPVYTCFFLLDRYCRCRAFAHTGLTPGTLFFVDNGDQTFSLHNNSFRWADVDTGLTVNAHLFVDFRFFVLYRYCRRRAFMYTGFASGTFTFVNDCSQLDSPPIC